MPEECRRDTNQWTIWKLNFPAFDNGKCLLVYNDLVEASLDQTTCDMLKLLASLDEEVVPLRDLDRDALPSIARPDMETGIARAPVDCKEIKIGMETGENGVFLSVLDEI